jgi:hypothetical protein
MPTDTLTSSAPAEKKKKNTSPEIQNEKTSEYPKATKPPMRKRVTAAQRNEYTPALTQRNLIQILFHDRLQQPCSLEEGLPTDGNIPTLMFGAAQPPHNGPALSRVDLDQQIVKDLLPFLHHFVETGKLPGLPNTAQDQPVTPPPPPELPEFQQVSESPRPIAKDPCLTE